MVEEETESLLPQASGSRRSDLATTSSNNSNTARNNNNNIFAGLLSCCTTKRGGAVDSKKARNLLRGAWLLLQICVLLMGFLALVAHNWSISSFDTQDPAFLQDPQLSSAAKSTSGLDTAPARAAASTHHHRVSWGLWRFCVEEIWSTAATLDAPSVQHISGECRAYFTYRGGNASALGDGHAADSATSPHHVDVALSKKAKLNIYGAGGCSVIAFLVSALLLVPAYKSLLHHISFGSSSNISLLLMHPQRLMLVSIIGTSVALCFVIASLGFMASFNTVPSIVVGERRLTKNGTYGWCFIFGVLTVLMQLAVISLAAVLRSKSPGYDTADAEAMLPSSPLIAPPAAQSEKPSLVASLLDILLAFYTILMAIGGNFDNRLGHNIVMLAGMLVARYTCVSIPSVKPNTDPTASVWTSADTHRSWRTRYYILAAAVLLASISDIVVFGVFAKRTFRNTDNSPHLSLVCHILAYIVKPIVLFLLKRLAKATTAVFPQSLFSGGERPHQAQSGVSSALPYTPAYPVVQPGTTASPLTLPRANPSSRESKASTVASQQEALVDNAGPDTARPKKKRTRRKKKSPPSEEGTGDADGLLHEESLDALLGPPSVAKRTSNPIAYPADPILQPAEDARQGNFSQHTDQISTERKSDTQTAHDMASKEALSALQQFPEVKATLSLEEAIGSSEPYFDAHDENDIFDNPHSKQPTASSIEDLSSQPSGRSFPQNHDGSGVKNQQAEAQEQEEEEKEEAEEGVQEKVKEGDALSHLPENVQKFLARADGTADEDDPDKMAPKRRARKERLARKERERIEATDSLAPLDLVSQHMGRPSRGSSRRAGRSSTRNKPSLHGSVSSSSSSQWVEDGVDAMLLHANGRNEDASRQRAYSDVGVSSHSRVVVVGPRDVAAVSDADSQEMSDVIISSSSSRGGRQQERLSRPRASSLHRDGANDRVVAEASGAKQKQQLATASQRGGLFGALKKKWSQSMTSLATEHDSTSDSRLEESTSGSEKEPPLTSLQAPRQRSASVRSTGAPAPTPQQADGGDDGASSRGRQEGAQRPRGRSQSNTRRHRSSSMRHTERSASRGRHTGVSCPKCNAHLADLITLQIHSRNCM